MPELPDLEAIRGFLNKSLPGVRIGQVQALIPFVVRLPKADFLSVVEGNRFGETSRRGKFLLINLEGEHLLVINAMLTGRLQYCLPSEKRRSKTCLILALDNGFDLRYVDQRLMGRIYLATEEGLGGIPQFAEMGPDALSPELTGSVFAERLRHYSGQIKNILVNQRFIAGIGNAYSDEILFAARINPFRKRSALSDDDVKRLYRSMHDVFAWATPLMEEAIEDELPLEEVRYFMRVHRRGGEACQVCGNRITDITAGGRVTSFCRHCQT
ncbi:MAG TPA: DNA-formamidopyrimidine glycosylase family protein [Dehalococcoidia bacterium]|nr:DNA-formamidopyrimidine glycosylase family protein [Dehalococcoidia bacterium]